MNKLLKMILLMPFSVLSGSALAQADAPVSPCAEDERFTEFDFWIGDWDVHLESGQLAGHNEIVAAHGGCVLIENWTSARGSTGMSINYLDHETGEWVQIWSDAQGGQINIRGGMTEDGMLLVGTIHDITENTTVPFRGLWTPLDDGRVRQFFEQYDPETESWNPAFDGYYSRRESD